MKIDQLARMYDRLTVWERIPLLVDADARGDETESRRLLESSPIRQWHFSEHLLAEQALHVLALVYVGEQLNAVSNYFFALWQLEHDETPGDEDWWLIAQASGYFFVVNAQAWKCFCDELGVAAAAVTAANHQGWFLPYCETHMPANAPDADTLQATLCATGREARQLVTAADLLARRRNLMRKLCHDLPCEGDAR